MPEPYKASCYYCPWFGTSEEVVILSVPLGHGSKKPNEFETCPECGRLVKVEKPMNPGLSAGAWAKRLKR